MDTNSKIPKLNIPNDNVLSLNIDAITKHRPLSPHSLENNHRHHHHQHNHYHTADYSSPLMKYLRATSPVATADDLFPSPLALINSSSKGSSASPRQPLSEMVAAAAVANDDDVVVMDGILVGSDSPSLSPSSSEICRAWENFGLCRYGSLCQFAHGKEERHPLRFPIKKKSKAWMSKSYLGTVSSPYISNSPFVYHVMPKAASAPTIKVFSPINAAQFRESPSPITTITKPEHTSQAFTSSIKYEHTNRTDIRKSENTSGAPASSSKTKHTIKSEHTSKTPASSSKSEHTSKTPSSSEEPRLPGSSPKAEDTCDCDSSTSTIISQNWSPLDDSIQVTLPSQPDEQLSREEIDSHIGGILYGPTKRRRLPVFTQIFAEK